MSDLKTPGSQLRSAYNRVVESGLTYFWDRTPIPGVNPDDPGRWYQLAWKAHTEGYPHQAEQWARAARHSATALWHEAKLAWLNHLPPKKLPCLAIRDFGPEYHLHSGESLDSCERLLKTLSPRLEQLRSDDHLTDMKRLLGRARAHLDAWKRHLTEASEGGAETPLMQAERLKAAHEYALCLDCLVSLAEPGEKSTPGPSRPGRPDQAA